MITDRPMTGGEIDVQVERKVTRRRLAGYHFADSRKARGRGWPDWVIIGPRGILYRETKGDGDRASGYQRATGYALQAHGLDWAVWDSAALYGGVIDRELDQLANARGQS